MEIPTHAEFEHRFHDNVWRDIAFAICSENKIAHSTLARAEHGENIVFFIDDALILKIYRPDKLGFQRERLGLEFIQQKTSIPVPQIVATGKFSGFNYLIINRLAGRLMRRDEWLKVEKSQQIRMLEQLARGLTELHSLDAARLPFNWESFLADQLETVIERQRKAGGNPEWLTTLPKYLDKHLQLLPRKLSSPTFMHGDVHFGNLRVAESGSRPHFTGMFDLADSLTGFHEYEFVAIGVLMIQGQGELQREFFRAYGYSDFEMNEEMRLRLMLLTILYEHSSLRRYAERLGACSEKLTL
jgi:hygromycin-B 7''-O-kinase